MNRKLTKKVKVGDIGMGGDWPISLQSMTNTDTRDAQATIRQIIQLQEAGCDLVRIAVFDKDCVSNIKKIKAASKLPLVADIHFDYKLAVASIEQGIDKLRINPGNIGSEQGVREIVDAAKERQIPIRIGVNGGSLKKEFLYKYGNTPLAMVESALEQIRILEKLGYHDIVISLKASSVLKTVEAYRSIAQRIDYPLHLGITEAGTSWSGTIKSSIGIGSLLLDGIGDTIRVSLTADPVQEIKVGKEILKTLGLRKEGIEIISCPTCGRCNINLEQIVNEVEEQIQDIKDPITIAVMGCVVNGPGEAKEADIGIAGGKGRVALFKKGKTIGTFPQEEAVTRLVSEIRRMTKSESGCNNTRI
ncbi:MAG: flavodoxin-dependent (E)-4-hydroxy-3-methylbut-2-enyl-diphosphate synthase [Clostridiales bacterium]|nr:flavodoxin-dependent (E)-4-hydroxy-3-methylbut-2-enyl-diphosphate synthase [Clostridiales bacterium]